MGDDNSYGHSAAWGSGIGGWDPRAIYQPLPYDDDKIVRVRIGIGG